MERYGKLRRFCGSPGSSHRVVWLPALLSPCRQQSLQMVGVGFHCGNTTIGRCLGRGHSRVEHRCQSTVALVRHQCRSASPLYSISTPPPAYSDSPLRFYYPEYRFASMYYSRRIAESTTTSESRHNSNEHSASRALSVSYSVTDYPESMQQNRYSEYSCRH